VGAVSLVAHGALLPAVSGGGDSREFNTVLAALGAGCPWAANAWTALGAAVAVACRHALGSRLLRGEAAGGAAAAWSWVGTALERRAALSGLDDFLRTMWRAVPLQRGFVLFDEDLSWRLVQYQQLDREHAGLEVVRPCLLMDSGARAPFARCHGFDPLAGLPPPTSARFARQIADGIDLGSPDSMILFLPREPSLRHLPKPGNSSAR